MFPRHASRKIEIDVDIQDALKASVCVVASFA